MLYLLGNHSITYHFSINPIKIVLIDNTLIMRVTQKVLAASQKPL
jgi:hypothetical protein